MILYFHCSQIGAGWCVNVYFDFYIKTEMVFGDYSNARYKVLVSVASAVARVVNAWIFSCYDVLLQSKRFPSGNGIEAKLGVINKRPCS